MPRLIDEEGQVHERGLFGGWQRQDGLFGPQKDTDWLGRPNVERDWLGRPVEANDGWGGAIESEDGAPLFRPASSSGSGGGGSTGASDALAGLASLLLVLFAALVIGALLALAWRILSALFVAYRNLIRRHPRAMLLVHLGLAMAIVGAGLYLAGFGAEIQVVGVALVPATWAWIWLTNWLPVVFMPINAAGAGSALWLLAQATRPYWEDLWSQWVTGFPLLSDLSLVLAGAPLILLIWLAASRRCPAVFRWLNRIGWGGGLWFLFMRVWTGWLPLWAEWTAPVPLLPPAGWLVFLLPLTLWLWGRGFGRWPVPFTFFNLLFFGGLMGLTAYHSQPAWQPTWRYWAAGLPLAGAPVLLVSGSPAALWTWTRASRRWYRWLLLPNLVITGGILWLIADRTRPFWATAWQMLWGSVPLAVDPALVLLCAPVALWLWGQGSRRLPHLWGALSALVWGGMLWWVAERLRGDWQVAWDTFSGGQSPDMALVVGLLPLLVWVWLVLNRRWSLPMQAVAWAAITIALGWAIGRLLPQSTMALRAGLALAPLTARAWLYLLTHHPKLGLALTLGPALALAAWIWLAPGVAQTTAEALLYELTRQGLPIDTLLTAR